MKCRADKEIQWTAEKAKAFVMKTKEALDDQANRVYYEL